MFVRDGFFVHRTENTGVILEQRLTSYEKSPLLFSITLNGTQWAAILSDMAADRTHDDAARFHTLSKEEEAAIKNGAEAHRCEVE